MKISNTKYLVLLLALMPFLLADRCTKEPTAKMTWEKILASCGASDLQNSSPLYFGAANANGVGSIWSYEESTKNYFPTSQLKSITARDDIVYLNSPFKCSGKVTEGVEFDIGIKGKPAIYPASAELGYALSKAQSVQLSVSSIVQEDAYWDAFNDELLKLPVESSIRRGIERNDRYVVGRAWRIQGFNAVLSFNGTDAISAKAELDAKAATGELGVKVKLTDEEKIEISSDKDLYIAGVFRKLSPTGVSGAESIIGLEWVNVPIDATANPPKILLP